MERKLTPLRIAVAASLAIWGGTAVAAPIKCDVDAPNGKNYMEVPDTQVVACLDAGVGNIGNGSNDLFLNGAGSGYVEIADNSDNNNYNLTMSSGTWSFDSSAWADYDQLALGFKFGTGNTADEWFVYSLIQDISSGTWTFFDLMSPGDSEFSISHLVLYGTGAPSQVPEPGTLALLGLGLVGLGFARRRRTV